MNDEPRLYQHTDYQMMYKDKEGEAHIVDLEANRYLHERTLELADFISQAPNVDIHPAVIQAIDTPHDRVIILPDMQVGYRKYDDGSTEPTHSEEAIEVALQIIADTQPHQVILNVDNIDFPTISKHWPENAFAGTMQLGINRVHEILAQIRASAPNAKIVYLAGNHEQRLEKYIARKAPELYDLQQANNPSHRRVLTVPFLLNLDQLQVEYYPGYPAAGYWLNDEIQVIHGDIVRQGGAATAAAMLKRHESSVIYGHVHRAETGYRSSMTRYGGHVAVAASFGCLANIEGKVPSYGSSVDDEGHPVRHVEDWQNAVGYLEIERKSGRLAMLHTIMIDTFNQLQPYQAYFRGKTYVPNP